MTTKEQDWTPEYSRWRHGGWYVSNISYPSGACGCVSNNYPDKKWRIACDDRRKELGGQGDYTFQSRDAAARAELELVNAMANIKVGAVFPEQKTMTELLALWKQLGDVPTGFEGENVDTLEESFLHFPVGTHREEIWKWFEQQNPYFIVGEVMQGSITSLLKSFKNDPKADIADGKYYSGTVLGMNDQVLVQKINRDGEAVVHDLSRLDRKVNKGDVLDIKYLGGKGLVTGQERALVERD